MINQSVKGFFKEYDNFYEQWMEDQALNLEAREMEAEASNKRINLAYQKQLDNIHPFTFAEATFLLDGKPLRFHNRDYLKLIYNSDIKDGLLMCGRQVEKSTTFSIQIGNWTLLTPFMRSLYFAPLNEQVKVFSEDRLGRLFEYSQQDVVKRTFITPKDKQNVYNKSFSNGSLIYLRHCYDTGDNIRGLSVNALFGDEVQDINIDALPVVKETQAHALDLGPGFRMTWFSGTPKTYSNTLQQLWNETNQCEWVVRCWRCNTDQVLGIKNVTPKHYVCRKCGRPFPENNIAKGGRWVKLNNDPNVKQWGFRITQMMNPAMAAEDTYHKIQTYDKQRLYNEVLGRSYENADKPFPPMLLEQMMANDIPFYNGAEKEFMYQPTFAGIDWGTGGKSLTIITIIGLHLDGRKQILYTKSYREGEEADRTYQFNDIMRLLQTYRVSYCIADYGHGFDINQKLKQALGDRFDAMYWSHNLGVKMKYDTNKFFWVANRTMVMHEYVTECKNGRHIWPGADKEGLQDLKEHHLAEQAEYKSTRPKPGSNPMVTRSEELYYTHPMNQPDDGVHSCVYASTAANLRPHGGSGITFGGAYSR